MKTILLDADIVAYKVAAVSEDSFDFAGDGNLAIATDSPEKACANVDAVVADLKAKLRADQVVICLSDPDLNWRKQLDPTYKSNRSNVRRPQLLTMLKDHLATTYPSYVRPRLEADDVMGILMTSPEYITGHKVMVSEDKDMRTIPGYLYNPNRPALGTIRIGKLDAERFHLWQTICGDATDGFPGARGVGPASVYAQEIITATRPHLWDIVLAAFASVGLGEEEAIGQARMARILRDVDWNNETKKVRLWDPTFLQY